MVQKASIFLAVFCFLISAHAYGQAERDTLYYEIQPEMIEQARVDTMANKEAGYYVHVRLKEDYHTEFGELTSDNIGNYLAVTYDGKVINPKLPTIVAKVSQGFSIGSFKNKEKAKKVRSQILGETTGQR